jgi:GH24 family phage-related lysozyme (muramidase)
MPEPIDLEFLRNEEGFELDAYVPRDNNGNPATPGSGVTFGTGIDIGQISMDQFNKLPISSKSKKALAPFVGLKGMAAIQAVENSPYKLSKKEADAADNYILNRQEGTLKAAFPHWDKMSTKQKTIIMSIYHNFGAKSFGYGTTQSIARGDYPEAAARLNNPKEWNNAILFPRRQREAQYLLK